MFLLLATGVFAQRVNDAGFLMALVVVTLFYKEYKKQLQKIRHDELLDQFLK